MTDVPGELAKYGAPSWLILTAVIILWFLSTRWASHLPGKLGAWSRWITNRQERALDREMSMRDQVDAAVKKRVAAEVAPILAENAMIQRELDDLRTDLGKERERHREELGRMRRRHADDMARERKRHRETLEPIAAERDLLAAWSVYVARWWHDKERALAEKGIDVPPPPWPAFQNWLDDITQRQNEETRP